VIKALQKTHKFLPGVFLLLSGCASTAPLLYVKQDLTHGTTVTGIIRNQLVDVQFFNGKNAAVFLSPQRILANDGSERLQFVLQLTRLNAPYVYIQPGRSLILSIDGQPFAYASRQGSAPRLVKSEGILGTTTSESAIYEGISKHDIEMISRAKIIQVVIKGRSLKIAAKFSEQNFAAFEALLQNISDPTHERSEVARNFN
jgi:hypothetical protein